MDSHVPDSMDKKEPLTGLEMSPSYGEHLAIDATEFPRIAAMTPEERATLEKKLLWKIDMRLLPMLVLMYIMNYLDRYAD